MTTINSYLLMPREVDDGALDTMKGQIETLISSENRQNDVEIAHVWPTLGVLQLKCDSGFASLVKNLTSVGNIEAERTVNAVKKPASKGPGI